jgi:hypothetical protein
VGAAVGEADDQAEQQPGPEPEPRRGLEVLHEEDRERRPDQREDGDEQDPEGALEVRAGAPRTITPTFAITNANSVAPV